MAELLQPIELSTAPLAGPLPTLRLYRVPQPLRQAFPSLPLKLMFLLTHLQVIGIRATRDVQWQQPEVLRLGAEKVLLRLRLLPRRRTSLVIPPSAVKLPTLLKDPTIEQSPPVHLPTTPPPVTTLNYLVVHGRLHMLLLLPRVTRPFRLPSSPQVLELRSGLRQPPHPVHRLKLLTLNTAGVPPPVSLDDSADLQSLEAVDRTLIRMLALPAHTLVSLPYRLMILGPPPRKQIRFVLSPASELYVVSFSANVVVSTRITFPDSPPTDPSLLLVVMELFCIRRRMGRWIVHAVAGVVGPVAVYPATCRSGPPARSRRRSAVQVHS